MTWADAGFWLIVFGAVLVLWYVIEAIVDQDENERDEDET